MRILLVALLCLMALPAYAGFWYFIPSSSDFPLLSSISGLDVECDLDTSSSLSYSGTGTTWTSLAGSSCNMTISGFGFNDNAGSSDDSFDIDAGDFAYIGTDRDSAASHPDFVTNMSRGNCTGSDCDWWTAIVFNSGADPHSARMHLMGNLRNSSNTLQTNGAAVRLFTSGRLYYDHTNGSVEPDNTEEIIFLPNQDHIVLMSYDDSANKLTIYFNSYEGMDYTMDLGTASGSPSAAFHLLASGTGTHSFSNMELMAFSGGEGYVDEATAKEVISTYNDRRDRTIVPTDECDLSFDCLPKMFYAFSFGDSLSYSGSGSANNLIAVPNDGATQASYNMTVNGAPDLKGAIGVTGTGLELTGDADYLSLAISTSTPALRGSMDHTAGANTWCALGVKTPTAWTSGAFKNAFFGNAADPETGAMGWGMDYQTSGTQTRLNYYNGTVNEAHNIVATLSTATDYNFIVGLNTYNTSAGGNDTHQYYINDDTINGISNDVDDVDNGVDVTTGNWIVGANWDISASATDDHLGVGAQIYAMGCSQAHLTKAIAKRTQRLMERITQFDADGDGGIGTIGGEEFRGSHLLVAASTSSTSVTSSVSGGAVTSVDGLRFKFFDATKRARLHSIAVVVNGSNVVDDLTQVTWDFSNDFTSISAGEMTADWSAGSTKNIHLFNQATLQNGSAGNENNVYLKFASSVDVADIDHIYYCANHTAANLMLPVVIEDTLGNELTLTDEPTEWDDTEGGATTNGVFSVDSVTCFRKAYRYGVN